MKTKIFCMMVLCTGLLVGCDKESEKPDIPKKPPVEQPEEPEQPSEPEEPENPVTPPSVDNIIKTRIGDINMIVGTNDWRAVTYGNDKFVAVGASGRVAYSTDVTNWASKTVPNIDTVGKVVYGNGTYVAAVWYGDIIYSTDGINWNTKSIGDKTLRGIAYGNGKFVTFYSRDTQCYILTSTNGSAWTTLPSSTLPIGYYLEDIVYADGLFRAITDIGAIFESSDAITWNIIKKDNNIYMSSSSVAYGDGKYAIVGNYNYMIISDGNGNFKKIAVGSSKVWKYVTYINGKFLVVGENGYYSTSMDGINWTTPEQIKDESGKVVTATLNGVCAMP